MLRPLIVKVSPVLGYFPLAEYKSQATISYVYTLYTRIYIYIYIYITSYSAPVRVLYNDNLPYNNSNVLNVIVLMNTILIARRYVYLNINVLIS